MNAYSARIGARTGALLWRVRSTGAHRVVPDGALDLMWSGGRLVVAGPDTAAVVVRDGPETVGLRFPPGVAPLLLRTSAADLRDERVELRDLVPTTVPTGAPAALLEQVYLDLWAAADPDRDLIRAGAALDRAADRGDPVAAVAERAGVAERSLRRTSHLLFGYGLKTLSGIRRFQRAWELVRAGAELADAAARVGYADQPHLTREFTRFAGLAPARLATTRST
ncbi:helix-turn-helix domain-containing protein [Saccharopolyspora sp. CA-218241]|uniref:helix-turn-helix domain-containing protein n=1 Tax=Saccharopolyspora sp. CA-218241 TaxID=3240027 RepID=UPI003D989F06